MANKHIPYFNFYPADFMNGVRGLSAQEVGVYTMLLCRIYEESGPIEMNPLRLSTYCGMREKAFSAVLEKLVLLGKFTLSDGMLSNTRAEKEIQKRSDGLKIASKAGKVSAEKRLEKQQTTATTVEQAFNHTDTDTDIPEPNGSGRDASGPEIGTDLTKDLFDRGVSYLLRHGVQERQARSFIGKCRKNFSDTEIMAAFMAASEARAVDPVSWVTASLKARGSPNIIPLDRVMQMALDQLHAEDERKAARK